MEDKKKKKATKKVVKKIKKVYGNNKKSIKQRNQAVKKLTDVTFYKNKYQKK